MRQIIASTAAAAALLVALGGCAVSSETITFNDDGQPRHEHGWQDWWNYQFVYHPNEQVYFEPYTGTYHWFEGESWTSGGELPAIFKPDPQFATVVFLKEGQFPWAQHDTTTFQHASRKPFRPAQHDAVGFARANGWATPDNGEFFANVSSENDRPE